MDIVNYVLECLEKTPYNGPEIHYIMVDEVQDLPLIVVRVISKVVANQKGLFFAGDTAQTIAKGVGFRFGSIQ